MWLFLILISIWAGHFITAIRTVKISVALGYKLHFRNSLASNYIGLGFNQILPGGVGGDVLRITTLTPIIGGAGALKVVVIDRLLAYFMILAACSVVAPIYIFYYQNEIGLILSGFAAIAGLTASVAMILILKYKTNLFLSRFKMVSCIAKDMLDKVNISFIRTSSTLSIAIYFCGMISLLLTTKMLNIEVDVERYLLLMPAFFFISSFPISFAGWGVREASAILIFHTIGISSEQSLMISTLYGFALIIAGVPGIILWLRNPAKNLDK